MNIEKKTIIITGASSGLGRALAIEYANANNKLFLFGRSQERLQQVQKICEQRKAETRIICADICDKLLIHTEITAICTQYKVDIIIACAGVSAGTLQGAETQTQIDTIFNTNLHGSLYTIMPAIPFMIKNMTGTIVVVSSMAGLIGLSSSPSYSASKAAIKIFGDGMRAYLKKFHLRVCVVIPGYIDTPMTKANNFPMPFKISADKAAKLIIRGIELNKPIIAFPMIMYITLKIFNLLPANILDYINSKLPAKSSFKP